MSTVPEPLDIQAQNLKKAALIFRALNNPLRQQILYFLAEKGSINVTDIYKKLKLPQSIASQQLGILRRAGMVNTERKGKQIFYAVNYQRITAVHQWAEKLLGTTKK